MFKKYHKSGMEQIRKYQSRPLILDKKISAEHTAH